MLVALAARFEGPVLGRGPPLFGRPRLLSGSPRIGGQSPASPTLPCNYGSARKVGQAGLAAVPETHPVGNVADAGQSSAPPLALRMPVC